MKYAAIGFLAFVLMPLWIPLAVIGLFYDACKDVGERIYTWMEIKK